MQLETSRLIIKPLNKKDVESILDARNSLFILKYNAMEPVDATTFFNQASKEGVFYIYLKEQNTPIGEISYHQDSLRYQTGSIEISYWLSEAYTRHGYMKEALQAFIEYLFETYTIITCRVFSENLASRKLIESCGFELEGILKSAVLGYNNIIYDDCLYALFKVRRR